MKCANANNVNFPGPSPRVRMSGIKWFFIISNTQWCWFARETEAKYSGLATTTNQRHTNTQKHQINPNNIESSHIQTTRKIKRVRNDGKLSPVIVVCVARSRLFLDKIHFFLLFCGSFENRLIYKQRKKERKNWKLFWNKRLKVEVDGTKGTLNHRQVNYLCVWINSFYVQKLTLTTHKKNSDKTFVEPKKRRKKKNQKQNCEFFLGERELLPFLFRVEINHPTLLIAVSWTPKTQLRSNQILVPESHDFW